MGFASLHGWGLHVADEGSFSPFFSINIDAALIKETYRLKKSDEKVIALQNGCICCNLRGDLLEEILDLWKLQAFDYIIIESSGISEPEQVAETFDSRLSESLVGHKQLDEYTLETLDAM